MRINHLAHRGLLVPAVGLGLAVAMTACSSSSSSSSSAAASTSATASASVTAPASTSPSAAPTTAAPTTAAASTPAASTEAASGPAAIAAIKTAWVTFFNGKVPAATKITLVQNGTTFAPELEAAAKSPSGATAGASVQSVKLTSKTGASVGYSILISGTPVLKGQKGVAVYQDGAWKVGDSSFCALLALEGGGKAPAACKSAS
jgi:hypothetical protein